MVQPLAIATTNRDPGSYVIARTDRLGKPWAVTESGVQFISRWEAFRAHLYDNDGGGHGGNTTIGYGHLVHRGPISGVPSESQWQAGITMTRAFELLREDIKAPEKIINHRIHVPLHQHEYDALVDFVYNVRGHSKESLLNLVNTGRYDRIPDKFMEYTSAGKAHPGGLIKRRISEGNLFRNGVYDATH